MDERGQKQTGGLYQSPALVVMVAMTAAWLLGLGFGLTAVLTLAAAVLFKTGVIG